jgi:hypothetical protein
MGYEAHRDPGGSEFATRFVAALIAILADSAALKRPGLQLPLIERRSVTIARGDRPDPLSDRGSRVA